MNIGQDHDGGVRSGRQSQALALNLVQAAPICAYPARFEVECRRLGFNRDGEMHARTSTFRRPAPAQASLFDGP